MLKIAIGWETCLEKTNEKMTTKVMENNATKCQLLLNACI